MNTLKEELRNLCIKNIQTKISLIKDRLDSLQQDLESETKNTSGDKHETGRAMLHLEIENESQKLENFSESIDILKKIESKENTSFVGLGSIVSTTKGNFFISASIGQLQSNQGETYFAISVNSPIGSLLLRKKVGESIDFNGQKIQINKIF